MVARRSFRQRLPWSLAVGGIAVACGTSSDLDVTRTGSGGSGLAPAGAVGGKASLVGGFGPALTGGRAASGGTYPAGTLSCSYRGTCAHPYCTTGVALEQGCAPCAYEVCQRFPLCCAAMWDATCELQAQDTCNCACGVNTGGAPSTGGRASVTGGATSGGRATGGHTPCTAGDPCTSPGSFCGYQNTLCECVNGVYDRCTYDGVGGKPGTGGVAGAHTGGTGTTGPGLTGGRATGGITTGS